MSIWTHLDLTLKYKPLEHPAWPLGGGGGSALRRRRPPLLPPELAPLELLRAGRPPVFFLVAFLAAFFVLALLADLAGLRALLRGLVLLARAAIPSLPAPGGRTPK